MRNFIITFFFIIFISNNLHAEMKSSKILNNIFNEFIGKLEQVETQKFIYCGRYTTRIA